MNGRDIVLRICMTILPSDLTVLKTEVEYCPCYVTISSEVSSIILNNSHSITINIWNSALSTEESEMVLELHEQFYFFKAIS